MDYFRCTSMLPKSSILEFLKLYNTSKKYKIIIQFFLTE